MKTSLPLVLLSSLLFAPDLLAEPATRTVQTVQVADLDLATQRGRTSLDRRIRHAVDLVCGQASPVDLAGANEVRRCRIEARGRAERQVAGALATARQTNVAAVVAR